MALFETWLKSDLKKPLKVEQLRGNLFSSDNGGNQIGVEVLDNGSPATLTGSVYGYVIRADGATVTIEGTLSDNKASIVLPASAYVVVGQASIVIKVGTTTVGACTAYVYRATTDMVVDPGSVVPDISELLAKIADCEAATTAATNAATAAGYVNIAMSKSGKVITVTTTNSSNQTTSATVTEPTLTVSESNGTVTVTATDADGTTTVTFETVDEIKNSKADVINITDETTETIKTIHDGADGMPMAVTIKIEPQQSGTGTPAPDNVRSFISISGVDITREGSGKNLLDESTNVKGKYISESGSIEESVTNQYTDLIAVEVGETYAFSGIAFTRTPTNRRIHGYNSNGEWVQQINAEEKSYGSYSISVTIPSGISSVRISYQADDENAQFEVGSASSYEPYTEPLLKEITFPQAAGTVYGCEVQINKDGTGELILDYMLVQITASMVSSSTDLGNNRRTNQIKPFPYYAEGRNTPAISNYLPRVSRNYNADITGFYVDGAESIYVKLPKSVLSENSTDGIKTYLTNNPLYICCPIRKVVRPRYELTPGQITSLLGYNAIYADKGVVSYVDYSADTKIYIDAEDESKQEQIDETRAMIATTDTPVATENHATGDVFICNNQLIRATASIASGETIDTGTGGNAEVLNLASYIAEVIASVGGVSNNVNLLNEKTLMLSLTPADEIYFTNYVKDFLVTYSAPNLRYMDVYYNRIHSAGNNLSGSTFNGIIISRDGGLKRIGNAAEYNPVMSDFKPLKISDASNTNHAILYMSYYYERNDKTNPPQIYLYTYDLNGEVYYARTGLIDADGIYETYLKIPDEFITNGNISIAVQFRRPNQTFDCKLSILGMNDRDMWQTMLAMTLTDMNLTVIDDITPTP